MDGDILLQRAKSTHLQSGRSTMESAPSEYQDGDNIRKNFERMETLYNQLKLDLVVAEKEEERELLNDCPRSLVLQGLAETSDFSLEATRWKQLYLNLLDEFQRYKYATDALIITSDQAVSQKIADSSRHLQVIREEQEEQIQNLRLQLDTAQREKLILQTEAKGVRDQLDETSEKLRQKSILAEALQRQVDEHSLGSSLERHGEDTLHIECETKLAAAGTRVAFLQQEVASLSNKNVQLQRKITQIVHQSAAEISHLQKAIQGKADFKEKEMFEIQQQQGETLKKYYDQEEYIQNLNQFISERTELNEEVSKQVQEFAAQVAHETERTLQILEERLRRCIQEKSELENKLMDAKKMVRNMQDNGQHQNRTTLKFIAQIHEILSIPQNKTDQAQKADTWSISSIVKHRQNTGTGDSTTVVEDIIFDSRPKMKILLKQLTSWVRENEEHRNRLNQRILELEEHQKEQKRLVAVEMETYRKKCSFVRNALKAYHHGRRCPSSETSPRKVQLKATTSMTEIRHRLNSASSVNKCIVKDSPSLESSPRTAGGSISAQSKPEEVNVTRPTDPLVPSKTNPDNDWNNLLKRHRQFSAILNNAEKYLEDPSS